MKPSSIFVFLVACAFFLSAPNLTHAQGWGITNWHVVTSGNADSGGSSTSVFADAVTQKATDLESASAQYTSTLVWKGPGSPTRPPNVGFSGGIRGVLGAPDAQADCTLIWNAPTGASYTNNGTFHQSANIGPISYSGGTSLTMTASVSAQGGSTLDPMLTHADSDGTYTVN